MHKTLSQPLRYTMFDARERLVSVPFRFRSYCTGYSAFMWARKAIRYSPGRGTPLYNSGGSRGGDRGARAPPFFSTKVRPEGPPKNFLETAPPLSQGLDDRPRPPCPPPTYLKVWISHCISHIGMCSPKG